MTYLRRGNFLTPCNKYAAINSTVIDQAPNITGNKTYFIEKIGKLARLVYSDNTNSN